MKQGTANLAEDYRFIHKALRPVGTARRQIAAVPPSNSRPVLKYRCTFKTISVLQACCAVTTEYGIPSNFIRKSTASLQIKISTAQLNFLNGSVYRPDRSGLQRR